MDHRCIIVLCLMVVAVHRPLFAAMTTAPSETPEHFRGTWQLQRADGSALQAPYPDYVVDLRADPAASALLKNKGVSNLTLVKGATVTKEAGKTVIRFEKNKDSSLVLKLSPPEKAALPGTITVVERGNTVLESDVRLVEAAHKAG